MPSQPMAKKVLNTNRNTAAAIPAEPLVVDVQPARIAIEADIPTAPKSMSGRRPNFSIVKTAIQDAAKYSVPLAAARIRARNGLRPILPS